MSDSQPDLVEPETMVFSRWCAWSNRREQFRCDEDKAQAGIYLLAHFNIENVPAIAPTIEALPEAIIYIGMSKNFNNRPQRHDNGTRRYVDMFKDSEHEQLYVSVCPVVAVGRPDQMWYALLQYLEMKAQWEYTRQHRKRPAMHFKKKPGATVHAQDGPAIGRTGAPRRATRARRG